MSGALARQAAVPVVWGAAAMSKFVLLYWHSDPTGKHSKLVTREKFCKFRLCSFCAVRRDLEPLFRLRRARCALLDLLRERVR